MISKTIRNEVNAIATASPLIVADLAFNVTYANYFAIWAAGRVSGIGAHNIYKGDGRPHSVANNFRRDSIERTSWTRLDFNNIIPETVGVLAPGIVIGLSALLLLSQTPTNEIKDTIGPLMKTYFYLAGYGAMSLYSQKFLAPNYHNKSLNIK